MERDETIQEKEKRTYDLKKKNQGTVLFSLPACWANNLELEKFKFVLDYKIKELKKQIEPREREIRANQEQIHEMESELERFHKSNTQLELALTESRQKLRVSQKSHFEFSKKIWNFSGFFYYLGCWPWIGARAIASSRFQIAKYSNFGWASRRSWIHSRSSQAQRNCPNHVWKIWTFHRYGHFREIRYGYFERYVSDGKWRIC